MYDEDMTVKGDCFFTGVGASEVSEICLKLLSALYINSVFAKIHVQTVLIFIYK